MGDDYWQPTAECFQQLFSKPKMTEKLLTRPPFRYIHDIFSATLEATGFGEGLFSGEELDAKSIKDKDAKVNFLEKMIALVQMAAGEEIPVKASKVVAGQECEATNIFLQYLFKVATSGIDSGPIVAQIQGGGGEEDDGQQQEEDDGDDGADEEAARQAAEEEEEERKRQNRAAKKKQMEDEKAKQQQQQEQEQKKKQKKAQQEEAERQAREQEAAIKMKAKQKPKKSEPEPQVSAPPIIEEGQGDDSDDQHIVADDDNDIGGGFDINEVDPESKFGKKAMAQLRAQEEEDEADNGIEEDGGATGIKMGNIGRRGRKKKAIVNTTTDAPKRSYGGYSEDDIEYLKKSIQALCQATNPLGKSIDFVTEDIDSMVKEYEHWKLDYAESQSKLAEQQRITEQTIQPLQDVTLAQLEERIREEKSKIQNIRSQIIRNDNTIQNLLQSVISSG